MEAVQSGQGKERSTHGRARPTDADARVFVGLTEQEADAERNRRN